MGVLDPFFIRSVGPPLKLKRTQNASNPPFFRRYKTRSTRTCHTSIARPILAFRPRSRPQAYGHSTEQPGFPARHRARAGNRISTDARLRRPHLYPRVSSCEEKPTAQSLCYGTSPRVSGQRHIRDNGRRSRHRRGLGSARHRRAHGRRTLPRRSRYGPLQTHMATQRPPIRHPAEWRAEFTGSVWIVEPAGPTTDAIAEALNN